MSLSTRLIAATTALALSLAAVSPAAAMDSDQKKALGILVGIGAAAVLIHKMKDKDEKKSPPARFREERPQPQRGHQWDRAPQRTYPPQVDRRDNRGPSYSASCIRQIQTPRGWQQVVDKRCADHMARQRLPQNCAFEIRERGQRQTVYGQNCLADRGIRMSHR